MLKASHPPRRPGRAGCAIKPYSARLRYIHECPHTCVTHTYMVHHVHTQRSLPRHAHPHPGPCAGLHEGVPTQPAFTHRLTLQALSLQHTHTHTQSTGAPRCTLVEVPSTPICTSEHTPPDNSLSSHTVNITPPPALAHGHAFALPQMTKVLTRTPPCPSQAQTHKGMSPHSRVKTPLAPDPHTMALPPPERGSGPPSPP